MQCIVSHEDGLHSWTATDAKCIALSLVHLLDSSINCLDYFIDDFNNPDVSFHSETTPLDRIVIDSVII